MRPRYLSKSAHYELDRVRAYAAGSRAAGELLAVLTAWVDSPGLDADALRRAVDAFRRSEIAQWSDAVWTAHHERGIGTMMVLLSLRPGAAAAISLRPFL